MSNEILPNPEESHRLCQNIDRLLIEHLKVTNLTVSTAQYSTQVNMDEERFSLQNSIDKKKSKRKQYKRKKKQKKKQDEQSARICLSVIINEIYQDITNFEASREQIQVSLNQLIGGQKFHMFLNDAIKLQVKNIQKGIWDFMQSIISQNSLDQNSNDQQFYLQMIDYIYNEYCKLRNSSQEIQKIINLFMSINSSSNQHQNDHYGLDRSTFIFMIQSDQTIKSLLKFCHRRVLPKNALHSERIRELTQIVNKNEKQQYIHQDIQATQLSTSVDDEDQQKTTRRKRKRKLKDSDFKSTQEQVVRRLDDMVIIKDKRSSCQVTQEWANKLKHKYIQN